MRVIAGTLGGRVLRVPRSAAFRPTSDRVKETLFNILSNHVQWHTSTVCDLFAGSGSLGIEALSRGARSVTCVERDRDSLEVLRANTAALALQDRVIIVPRPAESWLKSTSEHFSLVLADPPYAYPDFEMLVTEVFRVLRPGGLFALEHGGSLVPPSHAEMVVLAARHLGTTALTIYERMESEA